MLIDLIVVTNSQCTPIILWLCNHDNPSITPPLVGGFWQMEARSPLGSLVLPGCGTSNHFPILCLLGLSLGHRGFFCNPHLSVSSSLTFVPYADILRGNKYIKGNMKIFPFFVFRDPVLSFLPPNHPLGPLGMEREKGCSLECLLWGGL